MDRSFLFEDELIFLWSSSAFYSQSVYVYPHLYFLVADSYHGGKSFNATMVYVL